VSFPSKAACTQVLGAENAGWRGGRRALGGCGNMIDCHPIQDE